MRTTDLEGNIVEWKVKGVVAGTGHRLHSSLHKLARHLIQDEFKTIPFKEEVPIPIGNKATLFLDFYIPMQKIAIEVHGQQHYQFSMHFHQTRQAWVMSQQRDKNKAEWCEINGITLIILPYNEEDHEWTERLRRGRYGEDAEGDGVA